MYENRTDKLISRGAFIKRMIQHGMLALVLVLIVLTIGVTGYHFLGKLDWLDAVLNASMILGGMGQVDQLASPAAKIFASVYALFSGLIFIAVATVLIAPIVHRLLHHFHIQDS